jgi:hypothetical protein
MKARKTSVSGKSEHRRNTCPRDGGGDKVKDPTGRRLRK